MYSKEKTNTKRLKGTLYLNMATLILEKLKCIIYYLTENNNI